MPQRGILIIARGETTPGIRHIALEPDISRIFRSNVQNRINFDDFCFSINTRTGKWGDFAESDAAGGDPVSLVAYMESVSQIEAARLLERMLGVDAEGKASRRERA